MNEPNPPLWPPSVKIFHPTDDVLWMQQELQATQDPVYSSEECPSSSPVFTCENHFSPRRTALLFAPGCYRNLRFEVGYYVQVLGLGQSAKDVLFVSEEGEHCSNPDGMHRPHFTGPFVPALNKHVITRNERFVGTSLDTFWRSAENFTVSSMVAKAPSQSHGVATMLWAVSQAAPLRRVHIQGNLQLHDGPAYASGGHLANARIDGMIRAGGQQQFCIRNVQMGGSTMGGAWSMVYVGCTGAVPTETLSNTEGLVTTVVPRPRVRMEKPYIAIKKSGGINQNETFELHVPKARYIDDSHGQHTLEPLLDAQEDDSVRDFAAVCVVRDTDPISKIQDALNKEKDVVLCPGIYRLAETLVLRRPNQVILGLGLATLEAPKTGGPCIHILPEVPGVRLAGIMLEATDWELGSNAGSIQKTSSLLVWGDATKEDGGCRDNPGGLWDIFIRVGGPSRNHHINRTNVIVATMMCIHSGHVIGDNLWLWRADHAALGLDEVANYPNISPVYWQTEADEYIAQTGLLVTGNDVTIYGLAVEHANGHQTVWSGERGAVYFYQCELPYDSSYSTHVMSGSPDDRTLQGDHMECSDDCGFLIESHVQEHELYAPGIYSNFRNEATYVATAIRHPDRASVKVVNPFTVHLDNLGGIRSIVNGRGASTDRPGIPVRMP